MSVSLKKGQKVNLTKSNPRLKKAKVCLGWENAEISGLKDSTNKKSSVLSSVGNVLKELLLDLVLDLDIPYNPSTEIDVDAAVLMIEDPLRPEYGKTELVYYGQLHSKDLSIFHRGDNLVGSSEAGELKDCEQIDIEFSKLDDGWKKLVVFASIYEAQNRKQNFGMISNAFIRIVDGETGMELYKYLLTENEPTAEIVNFGEFTKDSDGNWNFEVKGEAYKGSYVSNFVRQYLHQYK